MEVMVNHDKKLVEFWRTKADREDAALDAYLHQQYSICKRRRKPGKKRCIFFLNLTDTRVTRRKNREMEEECPP